MRRVSLRVLVSGILVLVLAACERTPPASPAREVVVWEKLGSWSGRGATQTESFTGETGFLRVHWKTDGNAAADDGTFVLAIHSAISGRPLATAVDHRGAGGGTAYVNEDPRVFYAVVESAALDWSFTVEEGVTVRVTDRGKR